MICGVDFDLVKAIKKSNNRILKQENDIVRKYNLTSSQYGVLECLYMKGDMSISELIERQISTSGTMTVIVKNLEKRKLVIRESDLKDKRIFKIILTDEGRNVVEMILPERKEQLTNFANCLTIDEKTELLKILYKIKDKYKEEEI